MYHYYHNIGFHHENEGKTVSAEPLQIICKAFTNITKIITKYCKGEILYVKRVNSSSFLA